MVDRDQSGRATWTVIGRDALALQLREAAHYVDPHEPMTLTTDPADVPEGAIATGMAMLGSQAASVVSPLYGFRVLEEAARSLAGGEVGSVYGCFGSCRLERGAAQDIRHRALPDLLAWVLDAFPSAVARVHARRTSLLASDDAWFITLRLADEVLITLEALATNPPGASTSLLVEITGSERVIRAEPTRQAVRIERIDAAATALPWWEDEAERLLRHIAARPPKDDSGQRLRGIWVAVERSAETSQAVSV